MAGWGVSRAIWWGEGRGARWENLGRRERGWVRLGGAGSLRINARGTGNSTWVCGAIACWRGRLVFRARVGDFYVRSGEGPGVEDLDTSQLVDRSIEAALVDRQR